MAEARPAGAERARPGERLFVRFYLALVATLTVATGLFVLVHFFADPGRHAGPDHRMLLMFVVVGAVVSAAAYPIVRRLTRRLERLQQDVDAWGEGKLSMRVAVEGRDEVARLAVSFNRAAARIEALVDAQKSLLANASHELRSPLARLRMAAELLQESAPPEIRDGDRPQHRRAGSADRGAAAREPPRRDGARPGRRARPVDLGALLGEECARGGRCLLRAAACPAGRPQAAAPAGAQPAGKCRPARRPADRGRAGERPRPIGSVSTSATAARAFRRPNGKPFLPRSTGGPAPARPMAASASGSAWCARSPGATAATRSACRAKAAAAVFG